MGSYQISVDLKSTDSAVTRGRARQRHREKSHVNKQVEAEGMLPQTKECQETPDPVKGKGRFNHGALESLRPQAPPSS